MKATPSPRVSTSSAEASQSDEPDGVQLRHGPKLNEGDSMPLHEPVAYENTSSILIDKIIDKNVIPAARHSDSHVMSEYSNVDANQRSVSNAQRKFHSKSFSLSENRVAANLNLFQQNRELWEKRTEMQSTHSLTAPRILTRNRIAPDLVMDLPVSNKDRTVNRSRESLDSSDETSNDVIAASTSSTDAGSDVVNSKSIEDMTSAERFATQNQCTLKKNERFSAGVSTNMDACEPHKEIDGKASSSNTQTVLSSRSSTHEKPKAEIKPQESTLLKELARSNELNDDVSANLTSMLSTESIGIKSNSVAKDSQHKSPIPSRNTQKFVSKFADLKLTGGCLSSTSNTTPISTVTDSSSSQQQQQQQSSSSLSSFKPQVKVKPHILRKPLVLPPTTPEMVRRNQE